MIKMKLRFEYFLLLDDKVILSEQLINYVLKIGVNRINKLLKIAFQCLTTLVENIGYILEINFFTTATYHA